ncbi:S66 peptidase family protein [Pseudonocardia kunmingensis]|uniref:Muramoyltetrapeptide carboxypeptidase n=1 Tax=Pseudonocardia kunmingensis TaxID=630975 RepID=A0A543DRQ3_9PSEU|nr:LD-carboxypeptidase [Pseudonocardia kunmingensis]TQM12017.1 muramoyltetrapeptide carboxypeptidase [Pseudonocardia kunmingensis]
MTACAVRPAPLRAGARVAVVTPAGPAPPGLLAAGLAVLESWGLRIRTYGGAGDRDSPLPYLAADDATRATQLQRAWCDPDVDAVLCARGGYGCLRVLDHLDLEAMAATGPTLFVGSSDTTALHAVLGPRCGLVTLFGPMVATKAVADDPAAREGLRRALFDPPAVLHGGPDARALVGGRARGVTVGGTLSLLVSGLGVPGAPRPPDGAIALLEDVTEAPYRIDHFLTHLLRAGWFDRVAGIALGSWQDCGPPDQVRDVVLDRLAGLGVPLVEEMGFGHCRGQLTVPLGAEVELDADATTLRAVGAC